MNTNKNYDAYFEGYNAAKQSNGWGVLSPYSLIALNDLEAHTQWVCGFYQYYNDSDYESILKFCNVKESISETNNAYEESIELFKNI